MNRIPSDTLVVVADGEGARVFRNTGSALQPSLQQLDLLELVNMNDDGPSGSIGAEASGQDINEATFAKQLAQGLNDGALKDQYEHLLLVADPQTLGRVRPLLHKQTQQRLIGELAKTLTNARLEDIERTLTIYAAA